MANTSSPMPYPPPHLRHPDYSEGYIQGYLEGIWDILLGNQQEIRSRCDTLEPGFSQQILDVLKHRLDSYQKAQQAQALKDAIVRKVG